MPSDLALTNSNNIADGSWASNDAQAPLPVIHLANVTSNPATIANITSAFYPSAFTLNHKDTNGPEFIKTARKERSDFQKQSKRNCRHHLRKDKKHANRIDNAAKNGQATEKTDRQLFDLSVDMLITKTHCDVICPETVQLTPFSDTEQAVALTVKNFDTTQHCIDKKNEIGIRKKSVKEIKKLITQMEASGLKIWAGKFNNLEMHIDDNNISKILDDDKLRCAINITEARKAKESLLESLHSSFNKIIDHCYKILAADNNLRNLI